MRSTRWVGGVGRWKLNAPAKELQRLTLSEIGGLNEEIICRDMDTIFQGEQSFPLCDLIGERSLYGGRRIYGGLSVGLDRIEIPSAGTIRSMEEVPEKVPPPLWSGTKCN